MLNRLITRMKREPDSPVFESPKLKRLAPYFQHSYDIQGWFARPMADIYLLLDLFQSRQGIKGNVAEIGVHHGKSFIPLLLLLNKNETALAIDCFDDQKINVEKSGRGNEEQFLKNVRAIAGEDALKELVLLKTDSMKLLAADIVYPMKNKLPFRIFSVDGSHTAKATETDFRNASETLADGGVLVVDDYFNQRWPGVSEAINKIYAGPRPNLNPFFIGWNKILFTQPEFTEGYRALLKSYRDVGDPGEAEFLGSKVFILIDHNIAWHKRDAYARLLVKGVGKFFPFILK